MLEEGPCSVRCREVLKRAGLAASLWPIVHWLVTAATSPSVVHALMACLGRLRNSISDIESFISLPPRILCGPSLPPSPTWLWGLEAATLSGCCHCGCFHLLIMDITNLRTGRRPHTVSHPRGGGVVTGEDSPWAWHLLYEYY